MAICEELVLGNFTSNQLTWENVMPHEDGRPHCPSQTHISTNFVHERRFFAEEGWRAGGRTGEKSPGPVSDRLIPNPCLAMGRAGWRRAIGKGTGSVRARRQNVREITRPRLAGAAGGQEGRPASGRRARGTAVPRLTPWCKARRRARRRPSPPSAFRHPRPTR